MIAKNCLLTTLAFMMGASTGYGIYKSLVVSRVQHARQHENALIEYSSLLKQAQRLKEDDQFKKASALYVAYLAKVPDDVQALSESSLCHNWLQDYDAAISDADRALAIDGRSVLALGNKSLALNNLSRFSEALRVADFTLTIDLRDGQSWCNRGTALKGLERYDEALVALNKHCRIHYYEGAAFKERAELYEAMGNHVQAKRDRLMAAAL